MVTASRKPVKFSPPFRNEEYEKPAYEAIIYEKDPPLGRIILNRPEKMNALSYRLNVEVSTALKQMELDDDIKVIIIKGAGRCFSAGYDITPMAESGQSPMMPPGNVWVNPDRDDLWFSIYRFMLRENYLAIWELQKPVIAQIHGYCLAGGTHQAAFCDMRIVAEDTQIGFPVSRNWTTGGYQYMPWLCGLSKAKFYMFTGRPMDGKEAYRCGWASAVFPADKLEEGTEEIAREIALVDTDLIMLTKRNINRQMEIMGFLTGIQAGMDIETISHFRGGRQGRQEGDEFRKIAKERGLAAALEWRDKNYRIAYRTSEMAQKLRQQGPPKKSK